MLTQAWKEYTAALQDIQQQFEATERMTLRQDHRAQGYQALMEMQAMAYNMVIAPRQNHPRIYTGTSWNTYFYTLGQNSPDSHYGALMLDGHQTYRLRGRMGAIRIMLMQVNNRMLGDTGSKMIGNYDFANMECNAAGEFEVIISASEHPGNWIQLDPESRFNFILMRRFITDWNDDLGHLTIDMLDPLPGSLSATPHSSDELSEAHMAERITMAARFVRFLGEAWCIGLYEMYIRIGGGKNTLAYINGQDTADEIIGSPSTMYGLGIFTCAPDEAIIIECEAPDSAYWSFQIGDVWSRSLDFMHAPTDINMLQAALDSDGKFRAVICHDDPGYANWLCPLGRTEFSLVMRNYRQKNTIAAPLTRTVKRSELARELPAEFTRISAAQRQANIDYRRRSYLNYYDR